MKKNYIARRRGTSVAAAALSFALVAPFAQPVVAPGLASSASAAEAFVDENANTLGDATSEHNQNPSGDGWNPDPNRIDGTAWRHVYWAVGGNPGVTQPVLQKNGSYNVDAIDSGQVQGLADLSNFVSTGRDVVSGRAMVVTPRPAGQLTATYDGFEPLADEVTVYFQWMDSDGSVSPVYSANTTTGAETDRLGAGRYAFAVPQWIDAKGKKHRFVAAFNQRYQVWVDPTNDPTSEHGNELVALRQAPGMAPGAFGRGSGEAMGEFPAQAGTNGNIQRTGVWMYERPYAQDDAANNYMKVDGPVYEIDSADRPINDPNNHKPQLIHDTLGRHPRPVAHMDDTYKRTVSGKVWLENGNESQLFTGAGSLGNDPLRGSRGFRVFATALTAEGAQAYDQYIEPLQYFERAAATKQWIEENPQYVAGTVFGEPNEDGEYTLRFPDDVFGSNAYTGAAMDQFQKHLYMWVEDKNGVVLPAYSTWTQPVFQDPRYNLQWSPTVDPSHNNAFRYSRFYNVNFATVAANDAKINITNYDNTARPARRGDEAKAELTGNMPVGATIEWRDRAGRVLQSCEGIESASDLKGCETFEVPRDAGDGQFYYVALTNGSRDISLDSFIVVVDMPQWDDLSHTPTEDAVRLTNIGKPDEPRNPEYVVTEVGPKLNADLEQVLDENDNPVFEDKRVLDPSEYAITLDPKTQDLIFDPTFVPEDGSRYRIEVRGEYPKIDPATGKPVYEQDSSDPEGIKRDPDTGEPVPVYEQQFIDDATVYYRGLSTVYEPEYNTYVYKFPESGSWDRADMSVKFTDEDDNPVELRTMDKQLKPKGAAFIVDPADLPEGWTLVDSRAAVNGPGKFSIDRGAYVNRDRRGLISFIPWDNNGEQNYEQVLRNNGPIEIPVTVNYTDNTSEKVTATIVFEVDETDVYDVAYGKVNAVPGEQTVLTPTLKHKDGSQLETIDGATYAIPDSLPDDASDEDKAAFDTFKKALDQGYSVAVDENTGVLTVTGPKAPNAETIEEFTVPVTVTYGDGSSEPASSATVQLDTDNDGILDSEDTDDDGDGVPDEQEIKDGTNPKDPQDSDQSKYLEPTYGEVTGEPGKSVTVEAPMFKDADGNTADAPEGTTFTPGEGAPEGVAVDKTTGKVTVPVAADAKTGDEVTVPVVVTYPDGTTDTVDVKVTVKDDTAPALTVDGDTNQDVIEGNEITPITVTTDDPAAKITVDKLPKGLTFDEKTGKITGTPEVTDWAKDEEKRELPFTVVVTDPSGNKTEETITITVQRDTDGDNTTGGNTGGDNNTGGNTGGENTTDDSVKKPTSVDESDIKPVKPTDDEQPTGIKVNDKDGDTKVTATDEDGNDIPVRIDDDGNVLVTPGEGVDGPITVVITDPDLPGGEAEILVPVEGHEEGRDDNDSNTSVDSSNVNEVQPTDDEQNTGVKVNNPTEETEVNAFDEDGKKIPVRIDEDGNVLVIPGTDVDGPITVIVKDPSLPGGQTEVKVPVVGHEENKDDNGDGKPGENATTVDDSKVETVKPEDKLQDTGIKIGNNDDDTEISVKDGDGNDIPFEVREDGSIWVNPGTDVDGPLVVTVTDPDLPGGQRTIVVPVEGHADSRDDNFSDAKPNFGGQRTEVKPDGKGTSRDPFQGKDVKIDKATITDGDASKGGWKFEVDEKTGVVTGTAPKTDELRQLFDREFKNNQPKDWNDFVKRFKNTGQPDVDVTFDFPGNRGDETATAGFDLVGQDGKSIFDPNGDFDGDGTSNFDELFGDGVDWSKNTPNPFGPQATLQFEGNGKNVVADGEPHIVGKVNLPAGTTGTIEGIPGSKVEVDENGNVSVTVPDNYIQPDGDAIWGRIVFPGVDLGDAKVRIVGKVNVGKCIASSVGFGLPLLALIPLGLAITVGLPGLEPQIKQFNKVIEDANTSLQRQLGIFNPEMARQAAEVNAQLKQVGMNLLTGAGILLLIPLIIGGAFGIANACTPGGLSEAFGSSDNR